MRYTSGNINGYIDYLKDMQETNRETLLWAAASAQKELEKKLEPEEIEYQMFLWNQNKPIWIISKPLSIDEWIEQL